MAQNKSTTGVIRLDRDAKLLLLIIAKQGYITDAQRTELGRMLSSNSTSIRFVSTKHEIEELKRLDELRIKFGIDGDCGLSGENDPLAVEIRSEIEAFRHEQKDTFKEDILI